MNPMLEYLFLRFGDWNEWQAICLLSSISTVTTLGNILDDDDTELQELEDSLVNSALISHARRN